MPPNYIQLMARTYDLPKDVPGNQQQRQQHERAPDQNAPSDLFPGPHKRLENESVYPVEREGADNLALSDRLDGFAVDPFGVRFEGREGGGRLGRQDDQDERGRVGGGKKL